MFDQRLCPLCKIPFLEIPIDVGTIEICEKCEGTFFEYDELKTVLGTPSEGIFHATEYGDWLSDRTQALDCPACGSPMEETEYATSKIHMDRCTSCTGIFLDGGEADAVNRYLTSLESPEVEKAEDEELEKRYQSALVKMAQDMYANITANS